MNKSPCFPMYPSDFYGDPKVRIMSSDAKAYYALLLMNMWDYDTQYSMPSDDATIAKILEINLEKWMKLREEIFLCFTEKNGRIISRRLKQEKDKQVKYRITQSNKGKLGGRPHKAVALPELNHGKPVVKPPNPNPNPNPKLQSATFILPNWIPIETWQSYLEVRTKKRAAKTNNALNLIVKELEKIKRIHNQDPVEVLNKSIRSGWTDVYPLKADGGNGNGKHAHDTDQRGFKPPYRGSGRQPAELSADVLSDIAEADRLFKKTKAAGKGTENSG